MVTISNNSCYSFGCSSLSISKFWLIEKMKKKNEKKNRNLRKKQKNEKNENHEKIENEKKWRVFSTSRSERTGMYGHVREHYM